MRNVHERHIAASADRLGALLEKLATDDDQLRPGAAWAPMVLDHGLEPGSRGGHDGIAGQPPPVAVRASALVGGAVDVFVVARRALSGLGTPFRGYA